MINFFKDAGVRETIESILVAIMLALMFKAFEAEAYIIPTGSMATTLRGEHFDLECDQCGFRYQTNCSSKRSDVRAAFCPICRYRTVLSPERLSDHSSFDGDRILVNKFIYDFAEPLRWDVIVFKNPKNAKQNYIKRLVGLPNESLLIEQGDIFTFDSRSESFDQRRIARKSPSKMRSMMQLVDDTSHFGKKLLAAKWPLRWTTTEPEDSAPKWTSQVEPSLAFEIDATQSQGGSHWLKYCHLQPRIEDWDSLAEALLPERMSGFLSSGIHGGGLIRDHYSYNEFSRTGSVGTEASGRHWVGDLGVEAWVQIESDTGKLLLETTEGGTHFGCDIDIATGDVSLSSSNPRVEFIGAQGTKTQQSAGTCSIRGRGTHRILFMNADNRLFLWVNGNPVVFGQLPYQDFNRLEIVVPQYSVDDPGDALPLGIGCQSAKLRVSRLKVWRDVYYTSVTVPQRSGDFEYRINVDDDTLNKLLDDPTKWASNETATLLASQRRSIRDLHPLSEGQYFPMGDNSPASQDARLWGDPPYVTRDLLLGRGLFLYWPHSWNSPFFGFPDFSRMKFIR